ncbi:DUF222 domain-containing protein [Microterricola gilva]|uniref:DUF222 domain-containing protein n=1 Tax=Microterricola gilva TaxID=393267 RepID=UPI00102C2B46|nr:DUF222 domain-containing protein [Microterricola gilva]
MNLPRAGKIEPMGTPTETLAEARDLLLSALADSDERLFNDDALLEFTASAEEVGRLADALRIKAAGEHAFRSRRELGEDRLSAKKGCRNAVELLSRITLASERTLTQRMRLGEATRPRMALTGETMPARFGQIADALGTGIIGYDSAAAIIDTLDPIRSRVGDLNVEHAETALVAAATGPTVESPLPFAADEIRGQARVWETVLDEDGVVPAEERAMQARGISAGHDPGWGRPPQDDAAAGDRRQVRNPAERVPEPTQQTQLRRPRPGRAERPPGDGAGPARRVREPHRRRRPQRGQPEHWWGGADLCSSRCGRPTSTPVPGPGSLRAVRPRFPCGRWSNSCAPVGSNMW